MALRGWAQRQILKVLRSYPEGLIAMDVWEKALPDYAYETVRQYLRRDGANLRRYMRVGEYLETTFEGRRFRYKLVRGNE